MNIPLFQKGDKVKRINPSAASVVQDEVYIVSQCVYNSIRLVGIYGNYEPTYFTLIERAFPESQKSSSNDDNISSEFLN